MTLRTLLFAAFAAGLGCPPSPIPPAPDADSGPVPIVDAGPPAPSDACGRGEAKLLELACKDSRGRLLGGSNLHGRPWAEICRENAMHGVDMRPACMASAQSCAEVARCR